MTACHYIERSAGGPPLDLYIPTTDIHGHESELDEWSDDGVTVLAPIPVPNADSNVWQDLSDIRHHESPSLLPHLTFWGVEAGANSRQKVKPTLEFFVLPNFVKLRSWVGSVLSVGRVVARGTTDSH